MANTFSVPLRAIGSYRGPQLNCFAPGKKKKVEQITIIHSSPSSPHSRLFLHKDQALTFEKPSQEKTLQSPNLCTRQRKIAKYNDIFVTSVIDKLHMNNKNKNIYIYKNIDV